MYFDTLPATIVSGEDAGKPRVDQIKNKKLNKDFKVEAARFEFPQFGPDPRTTEIVVDEKTGEEKIVAKVRELSEDEARSAIEEAATSAGGIIQLVAYLNSVIGKDAVSDGKAYIRTATSGEEEDIVAKGLKITRDFVLAAPERVTFDVKEVKSTLKEIQDKGVENLDEETLRALVAKMLGGN